MLSIIGHWLYGAIVSWGGIAGLIAVVAWVLWFLTPSFLLTYKSQLLHTAIAATVFMVAYTYAFNAGFAECKSAWDAANIQAAKDAAKRDADIAAAANSQIKDATDQIQKQADDLQRKVDDYEKQLSTRKGGMCLLDSTDVEQLRNIR